MVIEALQAADALSVEGYEVGVVNARFAKPVDREMVNEAFAAGAPVVTVEDHSIAGGFGSAVLETAADIGLRVHGFTRLGIPDDRFVGHGSRPGQLAEVGIDAAGIASAVRRLIAPQSDPPKREAEVEDETRSPIPGGRVLST